MHYTAYNTAIQKNGCKILIWVKSSQKLKWDNGQLNSLVVIIQTLLQLANQNQVFQ